MRKLNLTVLIGILVAALGFVLVLAYGRSVDKRVAKGKETTAVLVARQTVAAGTTAADAASAVESQKVPRQYVAEGALTSLDEVKGQVLLGPVGRGGQLTRNSFGLPDRAGAVKPSQGHIALAVGVALTPGVAHYVTPGSSVDVFVTYPAATTSAVGGMTKLFATGVKVLSVSVAEANGSDDKSGNTGAEATQVVAVLDVLPEDAEKIVNATTLGTLYLALSATDGSAVGHTTPGTRPSDVVGSNR
jgi:Flp pilus assembly protein CpaB